MLIRKLTLLAFLAAATLCPADIMVLKDGKRLEGNILNEAPDTVRMRYRLTEKIWDEKDFSRADIAEIIRQTPSEVALKEQKLKELLPTKDLMGADEYERLIQDRLRPFVNQFAGTPEAAEVEQIIKELQGEKEKVVSGQLKMDGNWLTAEEVKRDDYNIRALRLRNEIKVLAESKKWEEWIAALRLYDRFIDPAAGFIASTHYPLLLNEIKELLTKYEGELNRMAREQPILLKNQQEGVAKMIEPDKSRTEADIKNKYDSWKANYEGEKRNRIRWLTPYRLDAASLTEAQKVVSAERSKLNLLDLAALTAQNEALVTVFRYLADENVAEAKAALEKAKTAITVNKNEYTNITNTLNTKISALERDINAKRANQSKLNQGTGAIGGSSGPIVDERVAKAMADAQAPKQPEPAAADPNAPAGAAPAPAAPAAAPAPAATPAPVVAEEEGFPIYILIGGLALLAVLVIAMMAQKKKKQAE